MAYQLIDEDGNAYSADPRDYFMRRPDEPFEGMALVRTDHPYRTTTGGVVVGPRALKSDPTLRDLQRCSRDDDPAQHDRPRSAWVARALAGTLPAKVLA